MADLHFLFLQGEPCPFFSRVANRLESLGSRASGINLCVGDSIYWRGPRRVNYRGRQSDWPRFIGCYLDDNSVTDLVLEGEQRIYHKIAIAAAKERGIRVTVTDFGYLRPDWITLEADGMNGESKFPRDPRIIMDMASILPEVDFDVKFRDDFSTMARGDIIYHFSNFIFWWLYPHYRRPYWRYHPLISYPVNGLKLLFAKRHYSEGQNRLAQLKASDTRYFLLPLQLEYDFAMVAYSGYSGLDDLIKEVVESFAQHTEDNTRLLIKSHPHDPGLKSWKKVIRYWSTHYGIPDRVDYVNGGDLDQMIQASAGMVVVNSTSGIRALQLGSPVKALGQTIYDVDGLTHQGNLDTYWTEATPPNPVLVNAFLKAIAGTIHVRGVFYDEPGLSVAVDNTVARLHSVTVGQPILT